jgi:hypothetical protein
MIITKWMGLALRHGLAALDIDVAVFLGGTDRYSLV